MPCRPTAGNFRKRNSYKNFSNLPRQDPGLYPGECLPLDFARRTCGRNIFIHVGVSKPVMTTIRPEYVTLAQLFGQRLFRIPQYQRSYSWGPKQRKDLLDDIKRVYDRESEEEVHFMATVVGLKHKKKETIGTTKHEIIDIVDGQQRITTLILLLKAIALAIDNPGRGPALPRGHDLNTPNKTIRDEINNQLIKGDSATLLLLQTNHDSSNYFAGYLRKGGHPPSKHAKTIADRELLAAMEECEEFANKLRSHDVVKMVTFLKNQLTFILHVIEDESLVYTVFEVLNSRGLDVSWLDRLKSMLMALVFERGSNKSEHIDEIHSLWAEIYRLIGLRLGLSTESLRFAATLLNPQPPSRQLSKEDAAHLLHDKSYGGNDKVIETTCWIKSVTEAVDRLMNDRSGMDAVIIKIMQARMVATAVYLRGDFDKDERGRILHRWEKVTFRIYGLYQKDARTAVGEYVRLAWRIINKNLSSDRILEELSEIGRDYPAAGIIKRRRGTDFYIDSREGELCYFMYRYEKYLSEKAGQSFDNEQWNRIEESRPDSSIEHIHPQSRWKAEGIVHGIGNLLLLPPKLNSQLQDKNPRGKADDYTKTGLLIAQEVADYISKHGGWSLSAIKERETRLLEWATQEWAD